MHIDEKGKYFKYCVCVCATHTFNKFGVAVIYLRGLGCAAGEKRLVNEMLQFCGNYIQIANFVSLCKANQTNTVPFTTEVY